MKKFICTNIPTIDLKIFLYYGFSNRITPILGEIYFINLVLHNVKKGYDEDCLIFNSHEN